MLVDGVTIRAVLKSLVTYNTSTTMDEDGAAKDGVTGGGSCNSGDDALGNANGGLRPPATYSQRWRLLLLHLHRMTRSFHPRTLSVTSGTSSMASRPFVTSRQSPSMSLITDTPVVSQIYLHEGTGGGGSSRNGLCSKTIQSWLDLLPCSDKVVHCVVVCVCM